MAYGLMQLGDEIQKRGKTGFDSAAAMEQNRNQTNEQIQQAESAQKKSMAGQGAGMGAIIGSGAFGGKALMGSAAIGGPVGLLIGAGVGLLANKLFS